VSFENSFGSEAVQCHQGGLARDPEFVGKYWSGEDEVPRKKIESGEDCCIAARSARVGQELFEPP